MFKLIKKAKKAAGFGKKEENTRNLPVRTKSDTDRLSGAQSRRQGGLASQLAGKRTRGKRGRGNVFNNAPKGGGKLPQEKKLKQQKEDKKILENLEPTYNSPTDPWLTGKGFQEEPKLKL